MGSLSNSYAARDKYARGFGRLEPYHSRRFLIGYLMCPVAGLRKEQPMLDAILLALGFGFFALSIAYAYGCDRL